MKDKIYNDKRSFSLFLFQNQIIVSDYTHLLLLPYQGADVTKTVVCERRSPSGKHEKDEPNIAAFYCGLWFTRRPPYFPLSSVRHRHDITHIWWPNKPYIFWKPITLASYTFPWYDHHFQKLHSLLSLVLLPTFLTLGRPREFFLVSLGNVGHTYIWLRWRGGLAFPKICIYNSQYW